jgi:hypothetical protein
MSNSVADAILHVRGRDSMTPAPEPRESEPKANPPAEYDGSSRRKLEPFIAECEIMFATSPRKYRSESNKVLAAGSYLKGDPKKWFSNFFLLPPENRPLWFLSWSDFKEEIRRCWGLEDPEGAAEAELRRLNMSDKDHVSYFASKFRSIQYRLPDWSDRNFRNAFYAALAPRIRTQFVTAGRVPPGKLEDLITAAEAFDRAYWTNYELDRSTKTSSNDDKKHSESSKPPSDHRTTSDQKHRKKNRSNHPSSSATSHHSSHSSNQSSKFSNSTNSTNPSEPAYKKFLGSDGKLLPKERERRIANGLCLLCGQKGHNSDECPKRRRRDQPTSSLARATITLAPPTESQSIASEFKKQ